MIYIQKRKGSLGPCESHILIYWLGLYIRGRSSCILILYVLSQAIKLEFLKRELYLPIS